ncbi:hypothetical protein A3Q24_05730 [Lactobacillus johnsonii]|uniref:Transposase n=1 Tax=Lactobacillus johnsonii TaxID=33959 RepID=A0A267M8N7_LACJH|nr:hypothetical protein [Lactobacillus johnsonii]PAB55180.1 hypothetical protein A3Q24_05730 [Lactobacillus johnsonii]
MSKRTVKYKKHPLKGCYKMNKHDRWKAEMLLNSDWMKRRMHITNAMIYDEATRISGIDWLTDKNYSSRKYVEVKLQATHNLRKKYIKYAR